MKALVLEIRDDKAAILTSDGQIIKVDNKQYRIGQEITFKGPKEKIVDMAKYVKRWGTAIAAALFLFIVLGASYVSLKPYGVVSLDVNSSIEFTINRFDRVLYVNGINDGGRDILASIDESQLIYKNVEQAIDITIDVLRAEGYLDDEKENYVVVAANTDKEDHTDKLIGRLSESIKKQDNIEPIAMKASDDELLEAREMGTTAGKMMIVDKLDNSTNEKINKNKWVNKSVAAIVKECDKNTSDTVVASAVDARDTSSALTKSINNTSVNTGFDNGSESNKSANSTANNVYPHAQIKSQKSSSSTKTTKAVEPAAAPTGDNGNADMTVVGSSVDTQTAPAPTSQPAPTSSGETTPSTSDPVATPVPTVLPAVDPVVTPVPSVVPEIPVVQPVVTDNPVVQPTQPSEPAPEVQPSQPSEPASEVQPTQPSDPVQPSTPAPSTDGPVQDVGGNTTFSVGQSSGPLEPVPGQTQE